MELKELGSWSPEKSSSDWISRPLLLPSRSSGRVALSLLALLAPLAPLAPPPREKVQLVRLLSLSPMPSPESLTSAPAGASRFDCTPRSSLSSMAGVSIILPSRLAWLTFFRMYLRER